MIGSTLDDDLAADLDAQTEHPVRRRVLGAEVDPHRLVLDPEVLRLGLVLARRVDRLDDVAHPSLPSSESSCPSGGSVLRTPLAGGPVHV